MKQFKLNDEFNEFLKNLNPEEQLLRATLGNKGDVSFIYNDTLLKSKFNKNIKIGKRIFTNGENVSSAIFKSLVLEAFRVSDGVLDTNSTIEAIVENENISRIWKKYPNSILSFGLKIDDKGSRVIASTLTFEGVTLDMTNTNDIKKMSDSTNKITGVFSKLKEVGLIELTGASAIWQGKYVKKSESSNLGVGVYTPDTFDEEFKF